MSSGVVLDASALLAAVFDEPGGAAVWDQLETAAISSVNLAEVFGRMLERGADPGEAKERIRSIAVEVVDFDHDLALDAAMLLDPTRHLGLSLADRACLATAERLGRPALTADRIWTRAELAVEVRLIR